MFVVPLSYLTRTNLIIYTALLDSQLEKIILITLMLDKIPVSCRVPQSDHEPHAMKKFWHCHYKILLKQISTWATEKVEFLSNHERFKLLRMKLLPENQTPLGMPKWVWPSMNQCGMFFGWTSTMPLKHAPNIKFYRTWKVLNAKQTTPDQKLCWLRG